jgi:ABC-2 type transport system permease protein
VRPGELVAVSARLRLALLRGTLRAGKGAAARRAGLIGGAIFGGGAAVAALVVLSATRGHGRLPEDLAVVLFCALVVGWVALPVLTFGSDDLLDPTRLALLPLTGPQFVVVMGVGALIGVAPVATVIAALGLIPATADGPGSGLVAGLAVVLLVGLCVSASRAATVALSGLLRSRRGRDLGVVLAAVVALSFQLVNPLVQYGLNNGGAGEDTLRGLAGPLRWSPPGLLATAPGRSLPVAAASLLAVLLVIVVLLLVWERLLRRSLERPPSGGPRRRTATALDPRGVPVPAGRTGAIMAKDLRYLGREPRRLVNAITGALLPVLAIVLAPLAISGGRPPAGLVFAVTGTGLLSALAGANRFGVDGSATWVLISSATDRRDPDRDLRGGDLATALGTVPAMLVVALVLAAVGGGWRYLPAAVGLALALHAIALGVSDLLSVRAVVPVPPSQNAFGGGSTGQGCTAGLLVLVAMLATVVAALPLSALLVPGLVTGAPGWGLALLVVAPPYGLQVGAAVRRVAARQWAARAPEVLHVLTSAGT